MKATVDEAGRIVLPSDVRTVLVPTRPAPPHPVDIVETLLDEMRRQRERLD